MSRGPGGSVPAVLRDLTLGEAAWRTRGVLRPARQPPGSPLRFPPAADLSGAVDLHWIARWDLPAGEELVVETLPLPCVNVVVEAGRSLVHGPVRGRFSRRLAGRGEVVSSRLRPGAFRGFVPRPAWRLVDTTLDFREAFGVPSGEVERAVLGREDDLAKVSALEQFLRERLPAPGPAVEVVDRVLAAITGASDLVNVEELARQTGMGRRTLERLFRDHVGLSPKRVIRQARLQAAAEEAAKGRATDWARLANDLGYADQAHFIRDFRTILGMTPGEFARQAVPGRPAPGRPAGSSGFSEVL